MALPVLEKSRDKLESEDRIAEVIQIATLQLGPGAILVALTLTFEPTADDGSVGDPTNAITRALREMDNRIAYVYVRPSA